MSNTNNEKLRTTRLTPGTYLSYPFHPFIHADLMNALNRLIRYAEWVKTNAKKCPKCESYIEKNGGMNDCNLVLVLLLTNPLLMM